MTQVAHLDACVAIQGLKGMRVSSFGSQVMALVAIVSSGLGKVNVVHGVLIYPILQVSLKSKELL